MKYFGAGLARKLPWKMRSGGLLFLVLGFCCGMLKAQERYEVVISEIFADPSPPVGLPNYEWIEIKNVSARPFNLQGWRVLTPGTQSGPLPSFTLQPDSQLVICSATALPLLSVFGKALSVTSFPSLNNSGDLVWLHSAAGKVMHAVPYELAWYRNELKQAGGWSLEMIDPTQPCTDGENWMASTDVLGGTPGRPNSVRGAIPAPASPRLLRSFASDSVTIQLLFDRPVDSLGAVQVSHYSSPSSLVFSRAICQPPHFSQVTLFLGAALERGKEYTLLLSGIEDCRGAAMEAGPIKTGWAINPAREDIVINEILFNPKTGGVDFVELLNRSKKVVDLSTLYLANRNAAGLPSSIITCSPVNHLLFPGEYIALTENKPVLVHFYPQANNPRVLRVSPFPSYPDDKGTSLLLDAGGIAVDELSYNKSWHLPLISNPEGVSLERIDPSGVTNDSHNWTSAATDAGYATPGFKNSQWMNTHSPGGTITLSSRSFSPNQDGVEDQLLILYQWDQPGYIANITLFEPGGRPVKHLVRSAICGSSGHWKWDGLDEKGMKLPAGVYVLHIEIFQMQGKKLIFRKAVALTGR